MDTNGYKWISIFVHVTPVMDIHGYPWISMNIHEHPWILHGHLKRISMDMNGYPSWISVDKHIHRFTPTVFFNRGFHRFLIHSYPGYPWIRRGQLWWTFLMESFHQKFPFRCDKSYPWKLSMDIIHKNWYSCISISMNIHEYPWIFMDIHGYLPFRWRLGLGWGYSGVRFGLGWG